MIYKEHQEHFNVTAHYLIKLRIATNESRWVFILQKPITNTSDIVFTYNDYIVMVTYDTLSELLPKAKNMYPELFI